MSLRRRAKKQGLGNLLSWKRFYLGHELPCLRLSFPAQTWERSCGNLPGGLLSGLSDQYNATVMWQEGMALSSQS